VARLRLEKNDVVRLVTGNGGGFGDPRQRPKEKVEEDLKNGYVTTKQAEDIYAFEADETPTS
jgi:N-methylhydantoinase B